MNLPIDVVPGTSPPHFRWHYTADGPGGKQMIAQEGVLPPSVEGAVVELIALAKRLVQDNAVLRGQVEAYEAKGPVTTHASPPAPAHPNPARKGK